MWAVVHLNRTYEDSEPVVGVLLVQSRQHLLKLGQQIICKVQILNQDPLTTLHCLVQILVDLVVGSSSDLDVVQLDALLCCLLGVEGRQLVIHINGVGDQEVDGGLGA